MPTYLEAFRVLRKSLSQHYENSEANAIARQFLEAFSGKSYSALLSEDLPMSEEQNRDWQEKTAALCNGNPLQQVLGYAYFMNRRFRVNEHTLIPRPETEELVAWIISEWQGRSAGSILEVGAGTGCIAISLSLALPQTTVTSIDISAAALEIADANNQALGARVTFQQADFLKEKDTLPAYDIIVSNPPYIPVSEKEKLDKNVRDFEPGTALFVPDEDPFIFYRALALYGLRFGNTPLIYCELHQDYAKQTEQIFQSSGYDTQVRSDLFGNQRMLKAFRA